MEGVGGVGVVGAGVGEGADDVEELDEGAGPAVGEDEGEGVGFGGADVEEVDVLAVDVGGVVGEVVEEFFVGAPVVGGAPCSVSSLR